MVKKNFQNFDNITRENAPKKNTMKVQAKTTKNCYFNSNQKFKELS